MQYNFNIINDKMVCDKRDTPLTGNVNTYRCVFNIKADIENLLWFCVFERDGKAYVQPILDNECFIPHEVLIREGAIKIGCYATNLKQDDYKRISTNWVYFTSLEGAYTDASVPEVPEPDVWEELVLKSVPIIGENGNWFTYDMVSGEYVDTGISAAGSNVDLSDYYTKGETDAALNTLNMEISNWAHAEIEKKADKTELEALDTRVGLVERDALFLREDLNSLTGEVGDISTVLDSILAIQNKLIGG